MFFVSTTVKRSPLSLSLPFSLCLTHQSTNPIFWSRHGNTTLSLPSESRKNLKLLRAPRHRVGEILSARCADRCAQIVVRRSWRSGNAIFGHLPVFSARWSFDRFGGNDERRSLYEALWEKDERFDGKISLERCWDWLGIVAIELERRKISFFFTFLREKSRDWKLEGLFFIFNANNRGMDAE